MAFNRSRSVGEEQEAGVEGTFQIQFLLSFLCFSFVFLYGFFLCLFFCLPLIIARSLLCLLCGDAGALFTGFLLLRLAYVAKGGPKTEEMGVLWWSSPGQGLSVA